MNSFQKEKILTTIPPKNKDAIEFVISFPNTYSVGITSLGYQNAWKLFNQNENVKVYRWFTDLQENCHFSPGYIGFSLSWELDYKNVFFILEKNEIPLTTCDRGENDPLIFCGGQVPNANPEPFFDYFDFFLIGDLEIIAKTLINKVIECRDLRRPEKLDELAKLPGVYVPRLGNKIQRKELLQNKLSYSSILSGDSVWQNTFLIEVARSCPELCRFCLASYGSLPFRTPDVKEILIPIVDIGLKYTNKIGLLGASVTQHPEFDHLLDYLLKKSTEYHNNLHVQIASVRADTISPYITDGLYKLGNTSLTMAIESGSEKLRKIINKKVSNETILSSVQTIYDSGFSSIKLYGMVGLPLEETNDLIETIELLKIIKQRNKTKKLIWGCSVFVPKAGTPFQWFGVDKHSEKKLKFLSKELHKIGVEFRPESYKWARIQSLISRGNKNIGKVLEKAYRYGNTLGSFNKAIREYRSEIDFDHYIFNSWDRNITLPWENIQGYLNKDIVQKHALEIVDIALLT